MKKNIILCLLFLFSLSSLEAETINSETKRELTSEEKNLIINATLEFYKYSDKNINNNLGNLKFLFPKYNENKYGAYCSLFSVKDADGSFKNYSPIILYFLNSNTKKKEVSIAAASLDKSMRDIPILYKICLTKDGFGYDLEAFLNQYNNQKNE